MFAIKHPQLPLFLFNGEPNNVWRTPNELLIKDLITFKKALDAFDFLHDKHQQGIPQSIVRYDSPTDGVRYFEVLGQEDEVIKTKPIIPLTDDADFFVFAIEEVLELWT